MRKKKAYFLNTDALNKLDRGYKLIINNKPSDVDDDVMYLVLSALDEIDYKNIYVVGCGLGDILVNLKRLRPNAIVSGCEVSDMFRSYGTNHFPLNTEDVKFEIQEPPYYQLPFADVMISIDYLTTSHEGVETFKDMLLKSDKVVVFDSRTIRDYLETQVEGLVFEDFDMYTVYEGIKLDPPTNIGSLNPSFLPSGVFNLDDDGDDWSIPVSG